MEAQPNEYQAQHRPRPHSIAVGNPPRLGQNEFSGAEVKGARSNIKYKVKKADAMSRGDVTIEDEMDKCDNFNEQDENAISVHFLKSVKNMVASMLYVPLTVTAILAASHMWLLTNVLDISCMILVCFVGYFTGLKEYCPSQLLLVVGLFTLL